jgi:hypothetical protein
MDQRANRNNHGNALRCGHRSLGSGAAQATLTLTSSEKGVTRTFTTDDGGRYSFNQLPPAAYSLTVKAKGFETYQQTGIVLDAAETATQNVT